MSKRRKMRKGSDAETAHPGVGRKVSEEKPDRKEQMMQIVLSVISLCLLLYGTRIGIVTAFDGTMRWEPFLLPFLLVALLLTVFVVYGSALRVAWSCVLLFAGMALYAWMHVEDLEYCFRVLIYYINKRYEAYMNHKLVAASWGIVDSLQNNILLTWICFFLVYLVALVALRLGQGSLGLIPVYLVFVIGLSFGKAPDKAAIILLVCGCGIVLFLISVRHKAKRKQTKYFVRRGKKYAWNRASAVIPALCILLLSACVGFGLCAYMEDDVMRRAPAFQRKQLAAEEKIIQLVNDTAQYMRGVTGMGGDGLLSNSSPHYTNSKVMEVTVDFKPHTNIYLRGFTGETYQNNHWTKTDEGAFRQTFSDNGLTIWSENYSQMAKAGRFLAMSDEDLLTAMNQGSFWWSIEEDVGHTVKALRGGIEDSIHSGSMTITYAGKERNRKTGYVPYNANFLGNKGVKIQDDGSLRRDGKQMDTTFLLISQQRQKKYVNWMSYMGELVDTVENDRTIYSEETGYYWENDMIMEDDGSSLIENYQRYVNLHYGNINDGGLPLYQQFAEQYNFAETESDSISDVVGKIQQILWNNTSYSLDLKPLPMGQDFAEYFLFYQQKGYCEHYATAGTILLRECNLPARYVSGYRIDNDSFKDNGDGTYTARVLDSDAHAWTETWHPYTGWLPWEMTPSDGSESDEEEDGISSGYSATPRKTFQPPVDEQRAQEMSRQGNQASSDPAPSPSEEPEETDPPQPTDGMKGTVTNDGGDGDHIQDVEDTSAGKQHISQKMMAGIAVGLLFAIWITVMVVSRIRHNGRRKHILGQISVPGTSAVGFCAAYVVDALRAAGKKIDRDADEETWLGTLCEEYQGLLTKEEQEEMWQLVQVGTYSKQGASGMEQRRFWDLCRKCLRGVADGCSPPRKIIFHMIFKKE